MAFLAKTFLFFLLVLISSLQIQARESKFFNKFTHISIKNKVIPESQISQAPTSASALAPTPNKAVPTVAAEPVSAPAVAPASFYAESENGYGLYGHVYGEFPTTKETVPSTSNENDLFNEELSAENYETGYQNSNNKNNVYANNYNNNGYNNYNTNNYVTEKQGMSDTRFMQNYQNSYYNNNEYTNGNNYNNEEYDAESYESEKKGMSDTRFLENGKYFSDVKNENNYFPNGFASERATARNEGYYGNTQNANEFNTMEEFENEKYEP